MEFGGSPALKRSASCLIDSGRCSREELFVVKSLGKKSRSQLSRARGKSLLETLQTGACAHQGSRSSMEDVFRVILWNEIAKKTTHISKLALQNEVNDTCSDLEDGAALSPESTCKIDTGNLERVSFFAVFDGHGGIQAADFVNENLFNKIINQNSFGEDLEAAILAGFDETEKAFAKYAEEKDLDGLIGTTVTAALIAGNQLFIANLGDSEAIIYSQGQERVLTQSHVPSNNEEKKRVETAGGLIVTDKLGNCRLGHPNWNPNFVNIGVTRAIGDLYFKSESYLEGKVSGLIATPTISKVCLTVEDDFLIIASDGFWDVVTYKEAANFAAEKIKEKINSDVICQQLIQMSNDRKSKDNITVLLVVLNAPP